MVQILDYSAGYPGANAVKNAGYAGVIRYLRKEGSSSVRPITKSEFDDMAARNLAVSLVYQHVSKSRITGGQAAGRHDAQWALARAKELGIPDIPVIYFAADYDAPTSDWTSIGQYMIGAASVIGKDKVGCYGKWALLNYLFNGELISYGWQTYAWSPGHNKDPKTYHPRAHLFQRLAQVNVGGIQCDVNDVLKPYYGQIGEDEVSASEVWNHKIAFKAPGAAAASEFTAATWLVWTNYYASLTDRLLKMIADNEANDLTLAQLQQKFDEHSVKFLAEIEESLQNAAIDVDVTVGGKSVDAPPLPEGDAR